MAMEIFKLMGTVAIDKDKALKDIKAVQDQAERASTKMGGSFTKFSGYVEKHSAQIKKAGKYLTVFGGIATAAFALSVKSAANFEEQLANVSTMLDKSAMKILPEYRKGLQSLSVEFGESTQTLSKGLYDILSASIPPAEALGVLEVSAKAAAAGITDTGVAADAITTILNSYGFSADQAGVVSDKLFAIVKEGKTTFAELAPSIGKVAATASISGLSFDDLGASIATITRAGIRSEEAMTAINGVLRAFLSPTTEAIAAAKGFGLELNTNTLRTEGLTGVMELLKDATAEQLAAIFPNIRGLKGMAAALGDAEGYARSYALMLESAGLTQEAFEKQSSTLNFKLGQLKEMFNVIKVTIGTALMPAIEDITKKIMGVLTKVKEWTEANPKLTATMVKWAAGISGLMLVAGPLLIALPSLVSGVNLLIGVMPRLVAALGKGKIALSGLGTIGAGPIGLFIIAVTALVLGLKKWQEHGEKVREENEKIKASLLSVAEVANRIAVVKERIKDLEKQAKITGESIFLAGDIVKNQIKDLVVELEALENEIGEGKEIVDEFAQAFSDKMLMIKVAIKEADWGAYNKGLAELTELAEEGEISSSELYKRMRELAIATGVVTEKTKELEPVAGTIVTTVKDLTSEMELLTKEHEAYGKSVEDNVQYYTKMVEKLNAVEVILKTELTLLEQGTEEYKEKWKEILENAKAINTMKEALDGLIEPLKGLDLIAAKMTSLGDSIAEIPAKLELLKEKAVLLKTALDEAIPDTKAWWEAKNAYEANQVAIEELAGSFDEYGERGRELLERLIELTNKQKELQEAIDVVGVDKQSEAYRYLKIEYNATESAIASLITELNNLEREQRESEQAAQDLADAYKSITDKIFELTHTPMEVAIRKLDQQKQEYIDLGMEIGIVNKWYDLQIAKLHELNPELDDTTEKLKEATEATVKLGILGGESWEGFTTQIKRATASLSNFTKEGVAAAITQIKMHFFPLIQSTIEIINTGIGLGRRMAEYQLAELRKNMQEQINIILYGFKEYQNVLASLGGTYDDLASSATTAGAAMSGAATWGEAVAAGGIGWMSSGGAVVPASHFQRGGGVDSVLIRATPGEHVIDKPMVDFIKRTGLIPSQLTKSIISGRPASSPSMQRGGIVGAGLPQEIKYNIGPVYVAGDGDVGKIKSAIKQALDESNLQILRSGSEVIPGVD